MADLPSPFPLRDLFDAAVRHRRIRLTCPRCRHSGVFDAAALWWLFERRGWRDRFEQVRRRCVCSACWRDRGEKVRPGLELVDGVAVDRVLPLPAETDWKREHARHELARYMAEQMRLSGFQVTRRMTAMDAYREQGSAPADPEGG